MVDTYVKERYIIKPILLNYNINREVISNKILIMVTI